MAALLLLAFLAALSVLVLTGHGADTRDPEYSLGRLLAHRPTPGGRDT